MGEERVIPEHHGRPAPNRGETDDGFPADADVARRRGLMPGDHPEDRRLAAAAGAEQTAVAAVGNRERDVVDGERLIESLGDAAQLDVAGRGHAHASPSGPGVRPRWRRARRRWITAMDVKATAMTTNETAVVKVPNA